jgi:hypothetical protein
MKLHEEFKLYEKLWESVETSALNEDWYGADAEVEFETSVYPDIAKYFGLKDGEVVTYAYYYTDEVIVNYDDAHGRSHEIEKHVPLDQVEEWFKAGYTILDEAKKSLTEARSVAEIKEEIRTLMKELRDAERAERATAVASTDTVVSTAPVSKAKPTSVWTWDIYLTPKKKGTWTGIQNDLVFETQDKALEAAWALLNELNDEGELDGDPDDYYIEAFEVPLARVSAAVLKFSDLSHLISESKTEESKEPLTEAEDPYGYGPYKTFNDPTLSVGDYVLAPRSFSTDKKTYPARITSITRDWINYTISGFGFVDKGTKARPGSSAARGLNNLRRYLNKK